MTNAGSPRPSAVDLRRAFAAAVAATVAVLGIPATAPASTITAHCNVGRFDMSVQTSVRTEGLEYVLSDTRYRLTGGSGTDYPSSDSPPAKAPKRGVKRRTNSFRTAARRVVKHRHGKRGSRRASQLSERGRLVRADGIYSNFNMWIISNRRTVFADYSPDNRIADGREYTVPHETRVSREVVTYLRFQAIFDVAFSFDPRCSVDTDELPNIVVQPQPQPLPTLDPH